MRSACKLRKIADCKESGASYDFFLAQSHVFLIRAQLSAELTSKEILVTYFLILIFIFTALMWYFTGFFSDFFLGLCSSVNVTNLFQVRILLLMLPP